MPVIATYRHRVLIDPFGTSDEHVFIYLGRTRGPLLWHYHEVSLKEFVVAQPKSPWAFRARFIAPAWVLELTQHDYPAESAYAAVPVLT